MSRNPILARLELSVDGEDVSDLAVLRVHGREAIGECFEYRIILARQIQSLDGRERTPLDAADLVGQSAILHFERVENESRAEIIRTLHGIIAAVEDHLDERPGHRVYALSFVPRLWELSNVIAQEIFVGQTAPEVIRTKLVAAGMTEGTDFELRVDEAAYRVEATLSGQHADGAKAPAPAEPRLIVQYRESDLAFVSRLAEHEGISFFFEHEDGVDKVVFVDAPSGFTVAPRAATYSNEGRGESIRQLRRLVRSVPSTVYTLDYNYRAQDLTLSDPTSGAMVFESLGARAEIDALTPGTVVEYAPNVKTEAEALRIAKVRADEQEALRDTLWGTTDLVWFGAGMRVRVEGHASAPSDDIVIVSVEHALASSEPAPTRLQVLDALPTASPTAGRAGFGGHGEDAELSSTFTAVAAEKPIAKDGRVAVYRPRRTTPKPRIHGLLTAVVRGASQDDPIPTEELANRQHLDSLGRYLVRFHFDQGEAVMPRIRMAQPHAGAGYGMHFPLRPGVEVVVGFLDGDPDRPVILGAVPNPLHPSPVVLPPPEPNPALHHNEMNRIETRSGVVIQIGDGDPGLLSLP